MSRYKRVIGFGEAAEKVVRRIDRAGKRHSARAVLAWPTVAGSEISKHTQGFALREDRELVVLVDSAAWAHQLSLMSDEFLTRLNSVLGESAVRTIRFTVSRTAGAVAVPDEHDGEVEEPRPSEGPPLDKTERAQAERAVASISDPALREVALRVMIKDMELKKAGRETRDEGS